MAQNNYKANRAEACLHAVWGCFYRRKKQENAEFPIAGAILDAREKSTRIGLLAPDRFSSFQDGVGDHKLHVFRGLSAMKTPSNRLQAG